MYIFPFQTVLTDGTCWGANNWPEHSEIQLFSITIHHGEKKINVWDKARVLPLLVGEDCNIRHPACCYCKALKIITGTAFPDVFTTFCPHSRPLCVIQEPVDWVHDGKPKRQGVKMLNGNRNCVVAKHTGEHDNFIVVKWNIDLIVDETFNAQDNKHEIIKGKGITTRCRNGFYDQ